MKTASAYVRLSGKSTDVSSGLDTQKARQEALAEQHGLTIVAWHVDDGKSGALRTREAFRAWLADARQGRASHLLAFKFDRVGRAGLSDAARIVDVVEGVDADGIPVSDPVRFLTVDGIDSDVPGWEFRLGIESTQAKGERSAIIERVVRHRSQARERGQALGGRRAWAFQAVPGPSGWTVLRPVPERARAIREALPYLRSKEGSLTGLARLWMDAGLTPRGSRRARERAKDDGVPYEPAWSPTMIRRILTNPNLYGATIHRGEPIRNEDGTVRIDPEQAILTLAEWTDLQAVLAARSTTRAPASGDAALLSGILFCASCGRTLYPHRPNGGRAWTYRCRGGVGCPAPVSVLMKDAEEHVEGLFRASIGDRVPPAPKRVAPAVDVEERLLVEAALARAKAVVDDVTADEAEQLAALRQRRDLSARLAALREAEDRAAAFEAAPVDARTYGERYDDASTVAERTRLLDLALDRLTVLPGERGGRIPLDERIVVSADLRDYV